MLRVFFASAISLFAVAESARAESLWLDATELTGVVYEWLVYLDGGESQLIDGGPRRTTMQLPPEVAVVHSVSVLAIGVSSAGCSYYEGFPSDCELEATAPEAIGDLYVHVELPGVASWHLVFSRATEGFWFAEYPLNSSPDLQLLVGSPFDVEVHSQEVFSTPISGWWTLPRVELQALRLTFDVETVVSTQSSSWGAVKSLFPEN